MRERVKPLVPGQEIGNVIVLELEAQYASVLHTRYKVRYLCCGRERSTTHNTIKHRVWSNATLCRQCNSDLQVERIHERQRQEEIARRATQERFLIKWPAPTHLIGKHVHWYDKSHLDII